MLLGLARIRVISKPATTIPFVCLWCIQLGLVALGVVTLILLKLTILVKLEVSAVKSAWLVDGVGVVHYALFGAVEAVCDLVPCKALEPFVREITAVAGC